MKDNTLRCPHCGEQFTIDESLYAGIVKQVRDKEFKQDVDLRVKSAVDIAVADVKTQSMKELSSVERRLSEKDTRIVELEGKIKALSAVQDADRKSVESVHSAEIASIKQSYEQQLKLKDEQITYYKDFKAKQSTKMVGESLEQHCHAQFEQVRMLGFPNAYFEKDNEISETGSKGDFIFRDFDEDTEIVSIMFEMKNDSDTTASRHKNADFFKELDKDRREKDCEYAVLVSMLEPDSEVYNAGIVDVSHRYPKMYVIRPQFFIPVITLLRNAAMNAISYKKELLRVQAMDVDVTRFEDALSDFKDKFGRNYRLANEKLQQAVAEIDKSIDHLEKTKKALLSSDNNLRLANDKLSDLSVERLTKDNPGMRRRFLEVRS